MFTIIIILHLYDIIINILRICSVTKTVKQFHIKVLTEYNYILFMYRIHNVVENFQYLDLNQITILKIY